MLLSIKNLTKYKIEAADGNIGHVESFLFDDQSWTVRYLVIDTGNWLPDRKVLISPSALDNPAGQMNTFPVKLTREQIKGSPDIDTDKPVSRQKELKLHKYYNWAPYWGGAMGPAVAPYAPVSPGFNEQAEDEAAGTKTKEKTDSHLRSTKELIGYKLHAEDGQIGHVEDFIVHANDWIIRYMVVDTKNWLPGRKVIIPPNWIENISWSDSEVLVNVDKETIKNSPEFNPLEPVNRKYEIRFYDYYGRPKYWA